MIKTNKDVKLPANKDVKQSANDQRIIRVSNKDRAKLKGSTNWAALVAEEKEEGFRK
jgi:hypothetical protein